MQRVTLRDVDWEKRMIDSDLKFTTGYGEWEVVAWGGRFAVCKFSNERMRITADGQVLFGETLRTPDNALEVHWFNTREWAHLARRSMERIDSIGLPKITIAGTGLGIGSTKSYAFAPSPPQSEWKCYLFGASNGDGLMYYPAKGKEPNRFVRWCMKLMLGCTWVRERA
jgi:hypothetical protein